MRKGYNDHFRFQAKNPFLGEGQLVFANGDDSDTQAPSEVPQQKSIHEEIQAGPQLKASPELLALYPEGQRPTDLEIAIDEFQDIEVNLAFLDRINRYLQTDTEAFDLGALPWKRNAEKIEETVKNLQEKVTGLDLQVDDQVWATIRNKEESEQRIQMVQLLSTWHDKIYEKYRERAQLIHELTVKAYAKEYDELSAQWDDVPEVYRSYANAKKAQYEASKKHLLSQANEEIPLGEEKRLVQLLDNYKKVFLDEKANLDRALKEMERSVDLNAVQAQLDEVKTRKAKEFNPRVGEYISKCQAIISNFNRLYKEVERSSLDDTEKNRRMKMIKDYLKNFTDGLENVEKFKAETFSNSSPIMEQDEDGNDTEPKLFKGQDGKMYEVPIGLQDRIDMLKSGVLSPEQVQALAGAIDDEVKNYDSIVDSFVNDMEGRLDKALETVKMETIEGPITEGFGSNRELIWMSPMDIWTMLEYAGQSFERSMNRSREYKVGKVGSMISQPLEKLNWGPFKHFAVIPGDLDKKQTSAENEAVDFYMNDYKSNDDASVIQLSHEAGNRDQLKACIQLLAERGRLDWFDPLLLKQLNRFQKVKSFGIKPSDILTYRASTPKFHEALRVALDSIYGDADFFRNMTSQNESSFNSAKEKYKAELYNAARQRGGLQSIAVEMLRLHDINGAESRVDPTKFEYVIEVGITEGAIQPAELGLYMLIQAAKMGLLPYDRLAKLYANKAGAIPYLEIFNESIFDYNVLQQWAGISPLDAESLSTMASGRVPHKFMQWFHTFVMANPRVRGRITQKLSSGTKLDSDLVTLFIPYSSESSYTNMLQVTPQGNTVEEWVIHGASQYQLFALHNQLAHMDDIDKETEGKFDGVSANDELTNMIAGYVKWDSTLEGRYNFGKEHVRWTESMKKESPRCGFVNDYYFDGGETDQKGESRYNSAYGYAVKTREIIHKLDPEIFDILFKVGRPSKADVDKVIALADQKYGYDFGGNPPKDSESMYSNISGLIGVIIANQRVPGGNLTQMISEVKSGHAAFNKAHNEDPKTKHETPWDDEIRMYPPAPSGEETGGVSSGWVTS